MQKNNSFLTIITRTIPGRELLLANNQDSLSAQTRPNYQQIIIDDPEKQGVDWANGQMAARHWREVEGRYVLILDDDDVLHDETLIAQLEKHARYGYDLFVVKMDHGPLGILPAETWESDPQRGRQGCSSVIPSERLFLQAVKHYQPAYDGDFDYVKACLDLSKSTLWLDVVAARVQQIGMHSKV